MNVNKINLFDTPSVQGTQRSREEFEKEELSRWVRYLTVTNACGIFVGIQSPNFVNINTDPDYVFNFLSFPLTYFGNMIFIAEDLEGYRLYAHPAYSSIPNKITRVLVDRDGYIVGIDAGGLCPTPIVKPGFRDKLLVSVADIIIDPYSYRYINESMFCTSEYKDTNRVRYSDTDAYITSYEDLRPNLTIELFKDAFGISHSIAQYVGEGSVGTLVRRLIPYDKSRRLTIKRATVMSSYTVTIGCHDMFASYINDIIGANYVLTAPCSEGPVSMLVFRPDDYVGVATLRWALHALSISDSPDYILELPSIGSIDTTKARRIMDLVSSWNAGVEELSLSEFDLHM